jgi:putative transposase
MYKNHMERYAKNSGAIFTLKVHLVWCPKYRRSVLINGVDQRLKGILKEKAAEHGFTLHAMEVMPAKRCVNAYFVQIPDLPES